MEQQHFKVTFPVGTKLLISVFVLLALVIAFLNISAILLLREDKRAYTYQTQSTEAVLAGREFVNTAKHQLDTLRIALGTVDPLKPITPQQKNALDALVANQSDLLGIRIGVLDPATGAFSPLAHADRSAEIAALRLSVQDFTVPAEKLLLVVPELTRAGYGFLNMSRLDGVPALGVVAADTHAKLAGGASGIPVAFGLASLKAFGSELAGLNLTIATRTGWVLFDTDPTALFSGRHLADDVLFKSAAASKLTSGAQEYEVDGKPYIASYVQPGLDLIVFAKTDWRKAIRATYELLIKFGLLGFMAIGVGLVFAIVFSKTLTRPINRLYEATKEIAQGNFNLNLKVLSRDELGALTGSFNAMSQQISELIKSQADKIHLENELAIASTVQQTLIPPSVFQNADVYIHSHYQAASQCGGDWWGFFGVDKKLCLMIADATGHGMPSALITASARSCFSVMAKLAQEDPGFAFSPSAMLNYANRVIYDASLGKIMMTFFAAVIDFETMEITYASAGHNPPWLFQKQEDGTFQLSSLTALGTRLGEVREAPAFEEKSIDFEAGDILFMYTDGLIEGKNKADEMYSKKRARKLVEKLLPGGPKKVVEDLMADFLAYNDGKALDDDVTIATTVFLENPENGLKRRELEDEPAPPAELAAAAAPVAEPAALMDIEPVLESPPEASSQPSPVATEDAVTQVIAIAAHEGIDLPSLELPPEVVHFEEGTGTSSSIVIEVGEPAESGKES